MKFVNTTKETIRVPDLGIECKPEAVCEVPDGYAQPSRAVNGSRMQSTIEMLAPGLQPADLKERAEWLKVPSDGAPKKTVEKIPTIEEVVKDEGVSPGVAELLVAQRQSRKAKEAGAAGKE